MRVRRWRLGRGAQHPVQRRAADAQHLRRAQLVAAAASERRPGHGAESRRSAAPTSPRGPRPGRRIPVPPAPAGGAVRSKLLQRAQPPGTRRVPVRARLFGHGPSCSCKRVASASSLGLCRVCCASRRSSHSARAGISSTRWRSGGTKISTAERCAYRSCRNCPIGRERAQVAVGCSEIRARELVRSSPGRGCPREPRHAAARTRAGTETARPAAQTTARQRPSGRAFRHGPTPAATRRIAWRPCASLAAWRRARRARPPGATMKGPSPPGEPA